MDYRDYGVADIAIIIIGAGVCLIYSLFALSWKRLLRALKRGT